MGMLAKRQTKRLMSDDVIVTQLSRDEVMEVVAQVIDSAPAKKDFMQAAIGRSFEYRIDVDDQKRVAALRLILVSNKTGERSKGVIGDQFTIKVVVSDGSDGRQVNVGTPQALTTNDALTSKKEHEFLREGLVAAISSRDPGARVVRSRHDKD